MMHSNSEKGCSVTAKKATAVLLDKAALVKPDRITCSRFIKLLDAYLSFGIATQSAHVKPSTSDRGELDHFKANCLGLLNIILKESHSLYIEERLNIARSFSQIYHYGCNPIYHREA